MWNRFLKLQREGVVNGATIQVNYKKLGYDAVETLLLDIEPSRIEHLSRYVKAKVPEAFGPFLTASKYNVRIVVPLKSMSSFAQVKEDLTRKPGVSEVASSIWTGVWFTPENLSLIPVKPYTAENVNNDPFDADKIDLRLIDELAKNSRISFRALAGLLGVSIDTVARRYRKLRKEGVIASRIQIDPNKLGYSALANFYMKITPHYEIDSIINEILHYPDVFYAMRFRGDFSVGVMLIVKKVQDILDMGNRIIQIPGVKRTETVLSSVSEKWPLPRTYSSTLGRNDLFLPV